MSFRTISLFLLALGIISCSEDNSFESCRESSVADLRELSASRADSKFCRTVRGEVSFQFTGRCGHKGCFFLYDIDENGERILGDSIYLSDASKLPSKWKDTLKVRIARITGDYYPAKDYDCESFSDVECQRALYVRDVE